MLLGVQRKTAAQRVCILFVHEFLLVFRSTHLASELRQNFFFNPFLTLNGKLKLRLVGVWLENLPTLSHLIQPCGNHAFYSTGFQKLSNLRRGVFSFFRSVENQADCFVMGEVFTCNYYWAFSCGFNYAF